MTPEIEQVYRALTALEKSMAEQLSHLRTQLQAMTNVPIEVARLTESSEHQDQNLTRISTQLDDVNKYLRQEIQGVREKAEKNNDFSAERFEQLSKSITNAADRIEQKFGSQTSDIRKELNTLVSDYDKRIAAIKAVAAAISVAFVVLQSVIGISISSYVNGWKVRIEEGETSTKELRKSVTDMDNRVEATKRIVLETQRRQDEQEGKK